MNTPAPFEFATAGRVLFGAGIARQAPSVAREFGRRALVVTGRSPERVRWLFDALAEAAVDTTSWAVAHEPDLPVVREGAVTARQARCELVIAIGGGSVIDAGKAIAALATNDGDVLDYLEVIGAGRALTRAPLPCMAIPTTAGTGSEVTRNAVLASPEHRVKVSLRSALMLPRIALVDPDLTMDLPPALTASTGLDAVTQLIEGFVSSRANPLTDALAAEGLRHASPALRRAVHHGSDANARAAMSLASLFSGLVLANAGLGAVHGLAAPLGGMLNAPHGAVCAALLPHVFECNARMVASLGVSDPTRSRFDAVARLITGQNAATPMMAVTWLRETVADFQMTGLGAQGLRAADIPQVVEQAARASSMKSNPVALASSDLAAIVTAAL